MEKRKEEVKKYVIDEDIEQYINNMKNPKTYGGDIEQSIFCSFTQIDLYNCERKIFNVKKEKSDEININKIGMHNNAYIFLMFERYIDKIFAPYL